MSSPTPTEKEYDIVVLGATGYTASIICTYISTNLPTNLKWAIAGRSDKKLSELAFKLRELDQDRISPSIELVELERVQLEKLVKKTRVVINGIGPYHLFSSPVVEACAVVGTHYISFSLETPWIEEMIRKWDDIARKSGAIIIPTIALAPSDITAYLVAKKISEQPTTSTTKTTTTINSTALLTLSGMSSGSLSTILSTVSTYGTAFLLSSQKTKPFFTRLFGFHSLPVLGKVTTSFLAVANESVVHRSAFLMPEIYAPRKEGVEGFAFHEYLPTSNVFSGVLTHFLTNFALLVLSIPFLPSLLKKLLPEAGTGPDLQVAKGVE